MKNEPQEAQGSRLPGSDAAKNSKAFDELVKALWEYFLDVQSQQHRAATKAGIARRKARLQQEAEAARTAQDASVRRR